MSPRVEMLIESLQVLAAEPAAQLEHLRILGLPSFVDELALEFDDIAPSAEYMMEQGELNRTQREKVMDLNDLLGQMSGGRNAQLWTEDALRDDPRWAEVRIRARSCLMLFGSSAPE